MVVQVAGELVAFVVDSEVEDFGVDSGVVDVGVVGSEFVGLIGFAFVIVHFVVVDSYALVAFELVSKCGVHWIVVVEEGLVGQVVSFVVVVSADDMDTLVIVNT
jgi:hypothetical protein